ncbi:DNA repair protein XRCC4 isoform X2 [Latimeria chalumnae]|uniref:X-ray repair cross complementing 4 n=1 Tax=Latimeria chalumnae TaxID=7897 RepID=H3AV79_LATCH|nr:PREDICTED: DNA repair protein XRCC4 isoform X2 [Latimeria chalumnae]|eukprot:XP_005996715.1 PREDICTED: DNA repair protein XRCC4 isoform X2 [Latimeria chalumnae]
MQKQVCKIQPVCEPDSIYYLCITWKDNIGRGFDLILCDGQSAWTGTVSEEEISKEAVEVAMEREKYVDELCKALTLGAKRTENYCFDFSKDGSKPDVLQFSYEKLLKDVSFKLGSMELTIVSNPTEVIKELINYGLDCTAEERARNEHLQKENERLQSDWSYIMGELEKCVKAKEELEQDLYARFILVLNEKKRKIRQLRASQQSSSGDRADMATAQRASATEEDYGGSTDEESKDSDSESNSHPRPSTSANAVHKTISTDNSPHDTFDIAPSRKRRQRLPKTHSTEKKKAAVEEESSNPAPQKSGTCHAAGKSLETAKNIAEPEDLFEDF